MKEQINSWSCISNCGACCRLDPEERSDALRHLNTNQTMLYMSMVGPDGWCVNYDSGSRRCKIYENRPDFCKVSNFHHLFKLNPNKVNAFAIECCRENIKSIYGGKSHVKKRFESQLQQNPKNEYST